MTTQEELNKDFDRLNEAIERMKSDRDQLLKTVLLARRLLTDVLENIYANAGPGDGSAEPKLAVVTIHNERDERLGRGEP
jgi:hypothetical protein